MVHMIRLGQYTDLEGMHVRDLDKAILPPRTLQEDKTPYIQFHFVSHFLETHLFYLRKELCFPCPTMAVSQKQRCCNLSLTVRWPLQGHYSFCLVADPPAEIWRCHDVKSIVVSDVEIWDEAKHSFLWFYLFIFPAGHHVFRRRMIYLRANHLLRFAILTKWHYPKRIRRAWMWIVFI